MAILFGRDQLPVFLSFLVCGMLSGALFDLLKIKRRIFGAPAAILFVDDLLFMLCSAVLVIFNAFAFNDGNMKWYEIPFMTAGFALYRVTLSRLFIGVCFAVIDFVKRLLRKIFSPIRKLLLRLGVWMLRTAEVLYLAAVLQHNRRRLAACRFH